MKEGISFSDEQLLELAQLSKAELVGALKRLGFGRIHAGHAAKVLMKHYADEASAAECLALKEELVGVWQSHEHNAVARGVLAQDYRCRKDVAFVTGEVVGSIEVGVSVHRHTESNTELGVYLMRGKPGKGKVDVYYGKISVGQMTYKNGRLKDLAARTYTRISCQDADVEKALSEPSLS